MSRPSRARSSTSARGGDITDLAASMTKLRAQRTVALSELEALDNSAKVA